jgi:hypothetical protein
VIALDERRADAIVAGDRLLYEGRLVAVATVGELILDPTGTGRWPADDRQRVELVLVPGRDQARGRRLLCRVDDLVLVGVRLPDLIVLPSESS